VHDSSHRDDARARRRPRDDDDDDRASRRVRVVVVERTLESPSRRRVGALGRRDASSRLDARGRRGFARVVVERGSIGVDDGAGERERDSGVGGERFG